MVRIRDEEKRGAVVSPPPPPVYVCKPGENKIVAKRFKELGLEKFDEFVLAGERKMKFECSDDVEFYIRQNAFDEMLLHSYNMALKGKEAMGFILGEIMKWEKEYVVAHDAITAQLESTSSSVRFGREAFNELFALLDEVEYEYIIAGWYHSHIGYGSFMSDVDIETQKKYFNIPFHIAMVIDPINMEAKVFKLKNSKCIEVAYAIF